jgi:hypothetical protein
MVPEKFQGGGHLTTKLLNFRKKFKISFFNSKAVENTDLVLKKYS